MKDADRIQDVKIDEDAPKKGQKLEDKKLNFKLVLTRSHITG